MVILSVVTITELACNISLLINKRRSWKIQWQHEYLFNKPTVDCNKEMLERANQLSQETQKIQKLKYT